MGGRDKGALRGGREESRVHTIDVHCEGMLENGEALRPTVQEIAGVVVSFFDASAVDEEDEPRCEGEDDPSTPHAAAPSALGFGVMPRP